MKYAISLVISLSCKSLDLFFKMCLVSMVLCFEICHFFLIVIYVSNINNPKTTLCSNKRINFINNIIELLLPSSDDIKEMYVNKMKFMKINKSIYEFFTVIIYYFLLTFYYEIAKNN